ncbi:uncharacterized protein LOC121239540 [Juglans microcarpa x Juglans regia]|uniref:uncharacterized protein LOC121239540 n=1 Tax=Juglans microcarpa x Juglans regia TaxID=2249226 RepID=UPI001B7F5DF7|nr:uncharacterized protein LOC121239540 [Juglans microcarpa x Juglans regia]
MGGEWCTREGNGSYGVGVWKHIRRGWGVFSRHTKFLVGEGTRIKFWRDIWCGEEALAVAFPSVFHVACDQEASVADLMIRSGDQLHWNVIFSKAIHDWELNSVEAFFSRVYSTRMSGLREDKLWWNPAGKGIFSVRSFYKSLTKLPNTHFPWKGVWRNKAPPKALLFTWTVALGKILTTDNLRKRQVIILEWCCMCKKAGETVDHLMLHCEIARALWSDVFIRIGLIWVMPAIVVELLACWVMPDGAPQIKAVWKMVPICIMWCIWRERNERTFEDKELTLEGLRIFFYRTLLLWASAVDFNGLTVHDFLLSFLATR